MIGLPEVLQLIAAGLVTGVIFGLMGLGLSVILGTMGIVNMADGAIIMFGMYLTYWLFALFGILPFFAAFLIMPLFFGVGILFQYAFAELPSKLGITDRDALAIVGTIGLAALLEGSANILWSPDVRQIGIAWLNVPIGFGGVVDLPSGHLLAAALTIVVYVAVFIFFRRTYAGLSIRALIEDRTAASLMGVNVGRMSLIGGGLGISLGGIAACMLTMTNAFYPSVGWQFLLYAFVVVALGGMGNIIGSLIAGASIGVIQSATIAVSNSILVPVVFLSIFLIALAIRRESI